MKKTIIAAALMAAAAVAGAAGRQEVPSYLGYGTQDNVTVASGTWTPLISTSTHRVAVKLSPYSASTADILWVVQKGTTTPTLAVTKGNTLRNTDAPITVDISGEHSIWGVSLSVAGGEKVFVTEFK